MTQSTIIKRPSQLISILMIIVGGILLGWVLYDSFQSKPLPFERVLVDEGNPKKFPKLGILKNDDLVIRKYEIRSEGVDKPLAEFHIAKQGTSAPIPLSWRSKLAEPLLISDVEPEAEKKVADVIAKHLPKNGLVFSWWDNSRRLKLYNNIPVAFDDAVPDPIFVPAIWQNQRNKIVNAEKAFWGMDQTAPTLNKNFTEFHSALLLDQVDGVSAMRKIAKDKKIFVVLNLLDAYKIGTISPKKFGVGFKDFPRSKQSHGLIKGVKAWVKENGYTAYSVYPYGETVIRIFFLTDEVSKHTLLAALLPFNSSKPGQVPGTKLVYQHRGYWVYEITDQKK